MSVWDGQRSGGNVGFSIVRAEVRCRCRYRCQYGAGRGPGPGPVWYGQGAGMVQVPHTVPARDATPAPARPCCGGPQSPQVRGRPSSPLLAHGTGCGSETDEAAGPSSSSRAAGPSPSSQGCSTFTVPPGQWDLIPKGNRTLAILPRQQDHHQPHGQRDPDRSPRVAGPSLCPRVLEPSLSPQGSRTLAMSEGSGTPTVPPGQWVPRQPPGHRTDPRCPPSRPCGVQEQGSGPGGRNSGPPSWGSRRRQGRPSLTQLQLWLRTVTSEPEP